MHSALLQQAHRPWPLPQAPWIMAMEWHDLLFAHWPVPPAALAPLLPAALRLDCWQGNAYLGVVPFLMDGVRARGLPPVPGTARFPELNLRTYVRYGDKPGVWFFSLDAANMLAVRGARLGFHLPYFDAQMVCEREGEAINYTSTRNHRGARAASFAARYGPSGPIEPSQPGSLAHWLTERYCLYAADQRGGLWRGEIQHAPWPLQPAWAEISANQIGEQIGVTLDRPPELLHFARRIDVIAWAPERLR